MNSPFRQVQEWTRSIWMTALLATLPALGRPDLPPLPPGAGGPTPAPASLPVVRIVASDPTALAGSTTGAFTLIREDSTNAPLSVTLGIAGTAENGLDYSKLPATVTIPAGFLAVDLVVQPLPVPLTPNDKTVVLSLVTNAAYTFGTKRSATVLIAGDRFNDFPPTVSLTAPAGGSVITVPSTELKATASDSDGSVSKVSFFAGDHLIGVATNPPYVVTWTGYGPGKYSLFAKAVDSAGLAGLSSTVQVIVSNVPPVVVLTVPTNKTVFAPGSNVTLKADASDANDSVASVSFLVNGRSIATVTAPPYLTVWTNVQPGNYSITARAEDRFERSVTSESVKIVVYDAAPTVSLTAPADGSVFGKPANVTFSADAADSDDGVAKVNFYLDGQLLGGSTHAPYSLTWTNVPPGKHIVVARAVDTWGLATSSKAVRFTVTNAVPVIAITAPLNNATFVAPAAISITTEASDPDGSILRVSFWANDRLLGVVDKPPFTYLWKDAAAGKYKITTQATDDNGTRTESRAVNVVVNPAPR